MRAFLVAVLVRPLLFGLWSLAFWGAAVWMLLAHRAASDGPAAAVAAFLLLAPTSQGSMVLAVIGAAIAVRALQLDRAWRRQHHRQG